MTAQWKKRLTLVATAAPIVVVVGTAIGALWSFTGNVKAQAQDIQVLKSEVRRVDMTNNASFQALKSDMEKRHSELRSDIAELRVIMLNRAGR